MPIGGSGSQALDFYRGQIEDAGKRIEFLEAELAAVRDLAYRGTGDPVSALQEIQRRANHALAVDDPENSLQRNR